MLDSDIIQQLQAKSPCSMSQFGRNDDTMRRTVGASKGQSHSTVEHNRQVLLQAKAQRSALTAENLRGIDIKTAVVPSLDFGEEESSGVLPPGMPDDGRELVSSRRGNRGAQVRDAVAYEQGKRKEFETNYQRTGHRFQTFDEGQLSYRAAYNGIIGKAQLGAAAVMLLDDDEDGLSDSTVQQAKLRMSAVEVQMPRLPVDGVDGMEGDGDEGGGAHSQPVSPLHPHAAHHHDYVKPHPTSSFLSPERTEVQRSFVPPVGHYRPKHCLSESSVVSGYIQRLYHGRHHHGHANAGAAAQKQASLTAGEMSSAASLKRSDSPTSPTSPQHSPGSPGAKAAAAAAAAARSTETVFFRSGSPKIAPHPTKSDAPDEWYYPRNEPSSPRSFNIRGRGDLSQSTPRGPANPPSDVPDAYYAITSPTGQAVMHTVRSFDKQRGRPTNGVANASVATDGDLTYNAMTAINLIKPVPPRVDFTKLTPRKEMAVAFIPTTSIDFVESINDPMKPYQSCFSYDSMLPRKTNLRPMLDLEYNVNHTLTHPKPARDIDTNVPGHLPLTTRDIPTEIGEPPKLAISRPRITREIPFEQYSPRKAQKITELDVNYECEKPLKTQVYPRILGNPMIRENLSRDQRALTILPTKPTIQAEYAYPVPKLPIANYKFAKYVPSDEYHTGLISSYKYNVGHPKAPPVGTYFPPEPSFFELKQSKAKGESGGGAGSPLHTAPRTAR